MFNARVFLLPSETINGLLGSFDLVLLELSGFIKEICAPKISNHEIEQILALSPYFSPQSCFGHALDVGENVDFVGDLFVLIFRYESNPIAIHFSLLSLGECRRALDPLFVEIYLVSKQLNSCRIECFPLFRSQRCGT